MIWADRRSAGLVCHTWCWYVWPNFWLAGICDHADRYPYPCSRETGGSVYIFKGSEAPRIVRDTGPAYPNLIAVGIWSVGAIIDTAFASYLPDTASIPAIANALMLFGLPSVLLTQAVSRSLLPHITLQATRDRYLRMSLTILKIVGGAVLLCIPAALALYFWGKPAIHLLFQHGAFNAHSSELTSMALFGYAIGLPGQTANGLLVTCFYALKDTRTPLFTGIVTIVVRIALLLLLFHLLTGRYTILAIPLAASIAGTAEAACLSLILFVRLCKKIHTDKGWLRLRMRRLHDPRTTVEVPLL